MGTITQKARSARFGKFNFASDFHSLAHGASQTISNATFVSAVFDLLIDVRSVHRSQFFGYLRSRTIFTTLYTIVITIQPIWPLLLESWYLEAYLCPLIAATVSAAATSFFVCGLPDIGTPKTPILGVENS